MSDRSVRTITEPARETPVFAETDVLVCGGGPAGIGAALAAARTGVRTMLLEKGLCLGGMGTSGMVNRLGPYHDQEKIVTVHGVDGHVVGFSGRMGYSAGRSEGCGVPA